jgi:polar amino acid transport system permease protein
LLAGSLAIVAFSVAGCSSKANIEPSAFSDWLINPTPALINGIVLTIAISVIAQILGVVLGVFAAMGKMAKLAPLRVIANFYIWFFRGTPLLVQLVLFRFGLQAAGLFIWPELTLGPLKILPEILAGTLILGVNEGAYMAEIVRAGILSVDPGQTEASKSLGMNYGLTMRRIVLPQAARVIIPPLGNEFNNMLKTTSLLSIVGVVELYNATSIAAGHNFRFFELFAATACIYLLMTTAWGFVQSWIERKLAKGTTNMPVGPSADAGGTGFTARMLGLRSSSSRVH